MTESGRAPSIRRSPDAALATAGNAGELLGAAPASASAFASGEFAIGLGMASIDRLLGCPGSPWMLLPKARRPRKPPSDRQAPGAPDLAASLQLASAPRRHKITNANQQVRSLRGQPVEALQLIDRDRHVIQLFIL